MSGIGGRRKISGRIKTFRVAAYGETFQGNGKEGLNTFSLLLKPEKDFDI